MPFIYKAPGGYWINIAFIVVVLGGLAILSRQSYSHDASNEKYQQDVAAGLEQAERAKELAGSELKIPVGGALAMLRNDAKTQGPKLFARYCVSCHDFSDPADGSLRNLEPTAPDLAHFATRPWLAGLLDPKQIATPKYFGNTKFKRGDMVAFVKETVPEFDKKDIDLAVAALSAEAGLRSQLEADTLDAPHFAKGRELISGDFGCTDCHTFHGKGMAKGPDLTGYGSRAWLVGIISDPAHKRFYGKSNDRMPAYAESSDPTKNTLSERDLGLLVDWLRGEWYTAEE